MKNYLDLHTNKKTHIITPSTSVLGQQVQEYISIIDSVCSQAFVLFIVCVIIHYHSYIVLGNWEVINLSITTNI